MQPPVLLRLRQPVAGPYEMVETYPDVPGLLQRIGNGFGLPVSLTTAWKR